MPYKQSPYLDVLCLGDVRQCQIWTFTFGLFNTKHFATHFSHFILDFGVSIFRRFSSISFKFHDYILSDIQFDGRILPALDFRPLPHTKSDSIRRRQKTMRGVAVSTVSATDKIMPLPLLLRLLLMLMLNTNKWTNECEWKFFECVYCLCVRYSYRLNL